MTPVIRIEDLHISFRQGATVTPAVRGVSLSLPRGGTVALVGESGSGKSVTAMSILRLLPPTATLRGRIWLDGREDLLAASERTLRQVRGGRVGTVFQEPMTSLNPLHNIEKQIGEMLALHKGLRGAAARARILELLDMVGLPQARHRLGALPHELSGGQRQRVMIAMALANEPELLIADEPTTALDVTIQAQILDLLADLKARLGLTVLFITHDLGIVRRIADHVAVMTQGEIVEQGPAAQVFADPAHAYTRHLLAAEPRGRPATVPAEGPPLLVAKDMWVWFPVKGGLLGRTRSHVKAVDGVSLSVRPGETVGVVGESGSGKTTLGLALLRLVPRAQGQLQFEGQDLFALNRRALRPWRARMQVVFQDPFGALSPRLSVGDIVGEGLTVHGQAQDRADHDRQVAAALSEVGLDPETRHRYPHEFSGGQRQRIAIARALVLKPRLLVLDEPTSALDVSVQAQIVALLQDLQARHNLAYVFISHDLRVVRALAHQVVVMKDGRVVEAGAADRLFAAPRADYTRALLAAAFPPDPVVTAAVPPATP